MRQRGFTLLELLIGMVLLGFILMLLFGGLRLGSRSWDAGSERVDAVAQLRATQGFLRRELEAMLPLHWKQTTPPQFAFAGEAQTLTFVAPMPGYAGGGGLYVMRLSLDRSRQQPALVLDYAPLSSTGASWSDSLVQAQQTVLAEGVENVQFAYFGGDTVNTDGHWMDVWQDAQRLPELLRIRVESRDGRNWPELVAALQVGRGCVWDDFYRRCMN